MKTEKGYKGLGMEGPVARWYAKNAERDAAQYETLARRLAAELPAGADVLEVAPGPGHLSVALAQRGLRVTGVDVSATFVEIARARAAALRASAEFRRGDASALEFPGASFDFVVCRAAFKNFRDPAGALREMLRVLKPGGRALVIDLRRDVAPGAVDDYVRGMGLGAVDAFATRWIFRLMLIKRAYTEEQFRAFAAGSGCAHSALESSPTGFELTLWK